MKQTIGARRPGLHVAGLVALVALPLLVTVVALAVRHPPWVPVVDDAMTELRVRDTLSRHPPLVGLPGRIGTLDRQGSHPGPMSFYVLSPVYRLLGGSAWALQAATVAVHLAAAGVAVWIGYRRGGRVVAAGVALAVVLLMAGYGPVALSEPWNPYLPVLAWVVFLLAVWSVAVGDLPMLPVVAAAGTFCAQTHVSYVALYAGLGALALGAALGWARAAPPGVARRRALTWLAVAAGIVVVLWLPPAYQQLTGDPGNATILVEHFGTPPEAPIGLRAAAEIVVGHLDLSHLVGRLSAPGALTLVLVDPPNRAVGLVVLVVWLASAAAALWLRHRRLLGLHLVIAVALLVGLLSATRIFGVPWYYLTLWLWGVTVVTAVAIGWTAVAVIARWWPPAGRRAMAASVGFWALAGVTGVAVAWFSVDAADVEHLNPNPSAVISEVVPEVTAAIDDGTGEATGRDGQYLVEWSDSLNIGENGFGLFGELAREGFDVGVPHAYGTQLGAHRVLEPADATAKVVLATGVNVDEWRDVQGAVEVAFADPRTEAERDAYTRTRQELIDSLVDDGAGDIVGEVDRNLFAVGLDQRLSARSRRLLLELGWFGLPTAVFIAPVDVAPA
jgi:hypothetical protein